MGKHSKGSEESTSVEPRGGAHREDGSGARQLGEKHETTWKPPLGGPKLSRGK